jgi:hypothetical protein
VQSPAGRAAPVSARGRQPVAPRLPAGRAAGYRPASTFAGRTELPRPIASAP